MVNSALDWLPAFLQTNDALFPTGAYAHSFGFEECVRLELVRDEASLTAFLQGHLLPAQEQQELPYLRFAFEAAVAEDWPKLLALEEEISAWKLPAETREASRQLGLRRLRALRAISAAPLLAEMEERIARGETEGHHLTVFALQAVTETIPLEAALNAWVYQALAANCSAALKLIRIGQDGVQRALRQAAASAPEIVARSLLVAREETGSFSPMLEIASMRHARAEERLFIS